MSNTSIIESPTIPRAVAPSAPLQPKTNGIVVESSKGCPALSLALSQARDRCKHAAKDSKHAHLGFKYASADTVIGTASAAMEGTGLSLIPVTEELVVIGGNIFALNRLMYLTHQSGEYIPLEVRGWPVIPDKGRPLDKAFAIALTSSLAYKLRDLLQMPRGDGDDMTARDDHHHIPEQTLPSAPAPTAPPPAAETVSESSPSVSDAQITTEQVDRIAALVEEKKIHWDAFNKRLKQKYGVERLRLLTSLQANEIEEALKRK